MTDREPSSWPRSSQDRSHQHVLIYPDERAAEFTATLHRHWDSCR
jgi:hypothetical protein